MRQALGGYLWAFVAKVGFLDLPIQIALPWSHGKLALST